MPNRLKPLNLIDFTGGVNLRPETFQLQDNELPELLNLEVDPRGGLNTRKSWKVTHTTPIVTGTWQPHTAYLSRHSDGTQHIYVTSNHHLYHFNGSGWDDLGSNFNCVPHEADFASWDDDLYLNKGWQQNTVKVHHTTVTTITASGAANWQNDYSTPGATDTMPRGEHNGQHAGYLFIANTGEDGVHYPNRLRWSHPNNPQRWASDDYIDLHEGGAAITAIIPFSDRLLVFKPDSVWAVFGYDAETWEVANISRTIGCVNAQCVARSENAVYFLSWPHGVFQYTDKDITESSAQIRVVFSEEKMNPLALDKAYLGWVERRLWCSLPYSGEVPTPTEPRTVFVYDPMLSSWTMFRGPDNCVPGPYIERSEMDTYESEVAVIFQKPYAVALDAMLGKAVDFCEPDMEMPFETRLRTRWMDAGAPTWRKSWRRPDFLLRALTYDSTLNVQVFHNYDYGNAERSFIVTYFPDNAPLVYGPDHTYGDGSLYGGLAQSSSIERGGTMGRAGTVQLLCVGFPTVQWGLNGIVFKFIPRRFR